MFFFSTFNYIYCFILSIFTVFMFIIIIIINDILFNFWNDFETQCYLGRDLKEMNCLYVYVKMY